MKIICIGRNYAEHAKELNNEVPDKPVFFLKPDTSILRNNEAFYYPNFSNEIHYEAEIVVKISKMGKAIKKEFASRYYNEISLGIDFTARDIQAECKKKGLPWEIAKSFDGAAVVGKFLPKTEFSFPLNFSLTLNEEVKQNGSTSDMIFDIDAIIEYISQFITLKVGDLIYTGTPAGVGAVKIGDRLIGKIENEEIFNFSVK
jgi:2-keto-4-pentenoate hydratase/2-oxohepta-3-ene-1,7-dioic acid hydratase in catechol pathway